MLLPASHLGEVRRPTSGPFTYPQGNGPTAKWTPPRNNSAGPSGVIHLTIYHSSHNLSPATSTLKGDPQTVRTLSIGTRGNLRVCVAELGVGGGGAGFYITSSFSSRDTQKTPMHTSVSFFRGLMVNAPRGHTMWTDQGEFFSPCSDKLLS